MNTKKQSTLEDSRFGDERGGPYAVERSSGVYLFKEV